MRLARAAAMLLATAGSPASAQVTEPLAATTDPADRAVMAEVASAVAGNPPSLARLDAVLARLSLTLDPIARLGHRRA